MKAATDRKNLFEQERVPVLMAKLCVPAVVTILVMLIYNMADLFFIGMARVPAMVAAIALSSPVFTILQAFGSLIGMGGCSAASIAFGAGNEKKVHQITSFCFYISLGAGILLGAIVFFFSNPIADLLGASAETREYVVSYIRILGLGAPLMLVSNVLGNLIRADGSAMYSLLGNGAGTAVNIILDPVFILVLHMGTAGAAIATVLGNAASAVILTAGMARKPVYSLKPSDFTLKKDISLHVISLGWSSAITTALSSIVHVFFNRALGGYGDNAIAAMSIASKASMLISMLQMGITLGIQPVLAYNYGAFNKKRLLEVIRFVSAFLFALGCALTVLCFVFRGQIVRIFSDDPEIIRLGTFMVAASVISSPISGTYQLCTSFLQASEKANLSALTAAMRQGLIFLPLLYFMNRLLGLNGVVFATPAADYISLILAFTFAYRHMRSIVQREPETAVPAAEMDDGTGSPEAR